MDYWGPTGIFQRRSAHLTSSRTQWSETRRCLHSKPALKPLPPISDCQSGRDGEEFGLERLVAGQPGPLFDETSFRNFGEPFAAAVRAHDSFAQKAVRTRPAIGCGLADRGGLAASEPARDPCGNYGAEVDRDLEEKLAGERPATLQIHPPHYVGVSGPGHDQHLAPPQLAS